MAAARSFLIYVFYYLAFLIPRKKKVWLYSSLNGKFLDNSKYFFLYAHKHCKDVRHIWISESEETIEFLRKLGFESYHIDSKKAKILALSAGAFIYSSYITSICNVAFTGGAFKFNLWHGIPLKKIEYDIKKGPLRYLYNPANFSEWWKRFCTSPALIRRNSAVLVTSPSLVSFFSSAFKLPVDKLCIGQYPRLMPFGWTNEQLNQHIDKIEGVVMQETIKRFKEFNSVIVYMPTWRDNNPGFINEAIPDFKLLDEVCSNQNILFVLKLHVNTVFNEDLSAYKNILLLNSDLDMYPLMPFTTALLTDYSSVFFDYTLLNKRIIFYPFDLSDYKLRSRELYFDFDQITEGGTIAYCFSDLLNILTQALSGEPAISSLKQYLNNGFDYDAEISFVKKKVRLN